jgi:hypothetical protein
MAVPILWRTKRQRYSLRGEVCPECARAVFPPREICPYCNQAMDALYASKQTPEESREERQAQHEVHFYFTLAQNHGVGLHTAAGD